MNTFKTGDKVIVTAVNETDISYGIKVGDCGVIKSFEGQGRSKEYQGDFYSVEFTEGALKDKSQSMFVGQMEKFVEPKFEVNHKFKEHGKWFQIVKVAYNKKMKSYSYLVYCLEHGCPSAVMENEIPVKKMVMTIARAQKELSKFIGEEVIIKN